MNHSLVVGIAVALIGCAGAEETEADSVGNLAVVGGASSSPCSFSATSGGLGGSPSYSVISVDATEDTTIAKATPDANQGGDPYCSAKGGSAERSCLIKFSVPGVSTRANRACLQLSVADPSVRDFTIYPVRPPWSETGATWNQWSTGIGWNVPGAKGETDRGAAVGTIPGGATGVISVSIPASLVRMWGFDGNPGRGIVIANAAAYDGISFDSSEGGDSRGPRLLFSYEP